MSDVDISILAFFVVLCSLIAGAFIHGNLISKLKKNQRKLEIDREAFQYEMRTHMRQFKEDMEQRQCIFEQPIDRPGHP